MICADEIQYRKSPTIVSQAPIQDVLTPGVFYDVIIIHKDLLYPQLISTLYTHRSFIPLSIYYTRPRHILAAHNLPLTKLCPPLIPHL